MDRLIVVSLGGNAILPADKAGTIDEQIRITRETMEQVVIRGIAHDRDIARVVGGRLNSDDKPMVHVRKSGLRY